MRKLINWDIVFTLVGMIVEFGIVLIISIWLLRLSL
jgi:hypothetical protein